MKNRITIAIVAAFAAIAYSTSAYAVKTTEGTGALKIQYGDIESFTDIDLGFGASKGNPELALKEITEQFQNAADKYLPDGYTLEVSVEDIDLAGDRSPMSSQFGEYRVYREIYRPRIAFDYTVFDASEQVIANGSVRKSSPFYLRTSWGALQPNNKQAPYVTELVKRWASSELKRAVTQK